MNIVDKNSPGIGADLKKQAEIHPNKIAIYYEDNKITYKEFYHQVVFYQNYLNGQLDPNKKHKIALLLSNEPVFLEVYFAIIMLGWTAVPFDPKWTSSEAKHIKSLANPDLILINDTFTKIASYNFSNTVSLDNLNLTNISHKQLTVADSSDEFYLGFTSGSTGTPKGFTRNQKSWLTSFQAGEAVFNYDSNSILMAPGPLNHSLSLFGATHALHIGASFCLTTAFSAPKVFELIEKYQVTTIYGVPTMFNSLASLNLKSHQHVSFLSSGAKLQPIIKSRLKSVFLNSTIYEYYGASELSYVTYSTDSFNQLYPDSVGIPFPTVKITIRNSVGEKLPINTIGEIYVESDFIFSHYVNNKQATRETLTKHGAFIGDIGFINEIGALTVVGRKNNMLITGGQNVYPEEVEKVIKMADSVKEVVIVGLDDVHWGERIIAFIEWHNNDNANLTHVKTLCKNTLSVYKRPRKYYTIDKLPYTHTGKVAREHIKQHIEEWIK